MARPLDDQSAETLRENERVVRELGDILHEQLLVGAGEAFDTVKKVKVLLAMEGELKKLKEC